MNVFSRMMNVFISPQTTFEAERQKSMWLFPFILYLILMIAWTVMVKPVLQQQQQEVAIEQMQERGMTQEQIDQAVERMNKMGGAFMWISTSVSQVIMFLIVSAVWLFVGNILAGGSIKYPQAMSVTAYSWLVVVVGLLIKAPIILSKQTINVHFSPAAFLSNEESFIYKLLAQFDLFNIWCFFIVTIGISTLTGKKNKQIWPWTALLFLLYFVGASAMQSAFGR